MASPRYPSFTWLEKLAQTKQEHPELRLSGHICGRWVRDICEGNWTIQTRLKGVVNEIKEFENSEPLPSGDDDYIVQFNHWLYKKFKNMP